MNGSLRFDTQWWAWWSNPLVNVHDEQLAVLPVITQKTQKLDYFKLFELRSVLALPDMPDDSLDTKLQLRALALASRSQLESHFLKLAVWGMDTSILHARAQDWQSNYGITSPDHIREIVTLRNEMPGEIYVWHDTFASQLKMLNSQPVLVGDRALLSLAIYLKSFFPLLYARWKLTVPLAISELASKLESIPLDLWETIDSLTSFAIESLHHEIFEPFKADSMEMPDLEGLDELDEFDLPSDLSRGFSHA
ncbi:hypothetical protein [Limnobacter parvus]|uniref:DUF4123 domain-containing protein n=1 Tax=Limnobacter parvus TaxID=2939690 RepID=A0ABT1XLV4_9BURK|nr:hypothetical protein [Limnobacter parvus]MCR2747242.1 hypothetical protein [Limnobacter parvus]